MVDMICRNGAELDDAAFSLTLTTIQLLITHFG